MTISMAGNLMSINRQATLPLTKFNKFTDVKWRLAKILKRQRCLIRPHQISISNKRSTNMSPIQESFK